MIVRSSQEQANVDATAEESARRTTGPALHASEGLFASAFRHAMTGMAIVAMDGRPLKVNDALCTLLGYSEAELCRGTVFDFTHGDDIAASTAAIERLLSGALPSARLEKRYLRKDGSVLWAMLSFSLVHADDGPPLCLTAQVEDIGERKQIERALRENENQFRTLAQTAAAVIFIIQGERFGYANAAMEVLTGYSRDELLEGEWSRIIAPEYRELAHARAHARQQGATLQQRDEVKILSRDGTTRWVEFTAAPIMYGGAPAILGTAFDITERRQVSQALRKSDERFALAVAGAHDGIWDWRFDRDELYVSPRLAAILGFGSDEIDSTPSALLALVHPDDRARLEKDVRAHAAGATPQLVSEYRIQHRDGAYRWVLTRGLAVRGSDGRARRMAGSLSDITDRKRSEEALRASEAKNKAILDASPDAFIRIRRDGTILDVKGDTSSWRTRAEDTVGRNLAELMPPEMAVPALETIAWAVTSGQMQTYEFEAPTGHGVQCLEARIVAYGEEEALCSIRDITARRRAEQEARQRLTELAHVARVSTMGEMAAALAHELNQPLMAIVGYASGCALRVESGTIASSELQTALRHVKQQAVRAGEIIRRLRDFVRKGPLQRSMLNLNDLAREVAGLAEVEARVNGVTLRLELDAAIPLVVGDPIQIEQVMLNLIRNGIEAMGEAGEPRLLTLRTGDAPGHRVAVTVIDRGKGLPAGIEDPFEPFISTKPKGLGMGLSISRSIVEAHGGRLTGRSDDEPSTTFQFTLPVARGGAR